jgi:hypothetical protein
MRRCKHERADFRCSDGKHHLGYYNTNDNFGYDSDKFTIVSAVCSEYACRQQLSLGNADEPHADVSAGRFVAMNSPVSHDWNLYLLDGGSIAITSNDQDNAWSWDPTRTIAEQIDECLDEYYSAAAEPEGPSEDPQREVQTESFDAMEYEITRAAEPDCRDEDDEVDQSAVCACTGDQLQAETCPEVES